MSHPSTWDRTKELYEGVKQAKSIHTAAIKAELNPFDNGKTGEQAAREQANGAAGHFQKAFAGTTLSGVGDKLSHMVQRK